MQTRTITPPSAARWRSAYYPLIVCNLLALCLIVVFSNWHDWDQFYAHSEVDLRSYLVFKEIPLWSYQLCGGVTRIGDPLAFSFSPLFLLPLALGSVWGLKTLMLTLSAAGAFFVYKILGLFCSDRKDRWALATLTVTSNYVLWHYYVGHVPFAMLNLGFGIIYFHLKCLGCRLSRIELLSAALLVFLCFSASFYHVAAFALLPFGLSLILFPAAAPRIAGKTGALGQILLFDGAGLLASAYRTIPAVLHQLRAPRSLPARPEALTLSALAKYALLPTIHFKWLGLIRHQDTYLMGEYSFFSSIQWLVLGFGAFLLYRRLGRERCWNFPSLQSHPLAGWTVIHAAVCVLLMLGDAASLSPFRLLNRFLFHDSLRVAARFGFGLILDGAVWIALFLEDNARLFPRAAAAALTCALSLNLLNAATFGDRLSLSSLREALRPPGNPAGPMRASVFIPSPLDGMFRAVKENVAVLNCYNGLAREESYLTKMVTDKSYRPESVFFLDRPSAQDPACARESYFTANTLHLSDRCRPPLCLRLNSIAPPERTGFYFDAKSGLYCKRFGG